MRQVRIRGRDGSVSAVSEREFFIDTLLVRIHLIIVMIGWTGRAPWEFESPFPGSLTSTFLVGADSGARRECERCLRERVLYRQPKLIMLN